MRRIAPESSRSGSDRAERNAGELVAALDDERREGRLELLLHRFALVLGKPADDDRDGAAMSIAHRTYSSTSRNGKRTPTSSVRMSPNPAPSSSARVRSCAAMLNTPGCPGSGGGIWPRS